MKLIVQVKGSPVSGWYSPPKGTHSGDKHREVGSGKAIVSKKPAKLSPMGQEVAKRRLRDIMQSISKDGSIVDASDSAVDMLSKMMAKHDERVFDSIDVIHTCEDMKSFSAVCHKYDALFPEVSVKTGNTNAFIVAGDITLGGGPKTVIVLPTFDPNRLSLFNHEIGHAWYYGLSSSARTSWNDHFHNSYRQPSRLPRDNYRANEAFADSYSAWIFWGGKPAAYHGHRVREDFGMIEQLLEG